MLIISKPGRTVQPVFGQKEGHKTGEREEEVERRDWGEGTGR